MNNVRLGWLISGVLPLLLLAPPAMAEVMRNEDGSLSDALPHLNDIQQSATTVEEWLTQIAQTAVVQITGVQANPTEKGVEVILQTTQGEQLQITNRSAENNFIADIPNAQLRLPNGDAFTFSSEKPIEGITEVTVTNLDANTIRVTVAGEEELPTVELFDSDEGLVFSLTPATTAMQPQQQPEGEQPTSETPQETPAAQQDDLIEILVTGQQDNYRVPNASVGTRTDTPLRDIPQSITVVPREVIEDRNARTITEAVETVPSVVESGRFGSVTIRGFENPANSGVSFRNGSRSVSYRGAAVSTDTIERVEVLRGPASVLFGQVEPGGIFNIVTRQPLSEPYYNLAFEAGSYGLYQPSIDLSGPLTADNTLLYRFIAAYQSSSDYQNFPETRVTTIAPSLTLNLGERTDLNLYYEYNRRENDPLRSVSATLSDGSLTPRDFYLGYPDFNSIDAYAHLFGYRLNHRFDENWQIRNNLAVSVSSYTERLLSLSGIEDDRFATFERYDVEYPTTNYFGQIDLLGRFNTGSISHQLLAGFDYNRFFADSIGFFTTDLPPLDIRNPNYDVTEPELLPFVQYENLIQSYGVYLQDQIAFSDNLKLLIGGRYDWISNYFVIADFGVLTSGETTENHAAFSPRIGLVYQPSDTVSLYASYSRSFAPTEGSGADSEPFEPTRGTQYEVGVRTEFLDGRLSANLAAYYLAKTNITTTDLANPEFSIQVGEQRSQGIELDVTGEILPGWNIIASYAYTDAQVTEDNSIPVGNQLNGVPKNQASLWTTYTIQEGDLTGLGFGLGLFYVGNRQGDLANSFELGDYLRTDAALYYRRGRLNAAINIRNLFDIDYTSFGSRRAFIYRGDPFTIVGSIGWEF